MYGRSTQFTGDPANVDEGIRIFKEEVVPAVAGQKGYKGAISLSDRASGKGISVTFWESEEDLRASEQPANQVRSESLTKLGITAPPTIDRMEVTYFQVEG